MKKLIISVFLVLFLLASCGHYSPFLYNFLSCVFYGDCSDDYYGYSEQSVQLVATGENDGISLKGEWQNENAEDSYILNFQSDGKLNIAHYKDNEMERYDLGKYSVVKDKLTIEMDNGTTSFVKYSIKNNVLSLTSINSDKEENSSTN